MTARPSAPAGSTCAAEQHGTATAYDWWQCRCPSAREAHRLYRKRLREHRQPAALIPALGTVRRLQALVAAGYAQSNLAQRLGVSSKQLRKLNHAPDARVTRSTAEKVVRLFGDLAATPGRSKYARTVASRYGWPPPHAWDDIDDSAAEPNFGDSHDGIVDEFAVELALAGQRVSLTDAELIAAVHIGIARGVAHQPLADLLCIDFRAVRTLAGGEVPPRFSSLVRRRLELVRSAA